jgi:LysM repeat protein
MKIPRIPKILISRRRKTEPPKPPQKLQARVRTAQPDLTDDYDYDDDEPQTKLTSAFVVVLILHVVAVGGIYAFNQIKASRRPIEAVAQQKTAAKTTAAAEASQAGKPEPAAAPTQPSATTQPASTVAPVSHQRVYNVKPGDTLVGIAKAFGLTVAELKEANNLTGDVIRSGQILNLVPSKTEAASTAKSEPVETKPSYKTYTVKSGDRLIFIAKKMSVTPEDIIVLNKIKDPTKLQIGQVLKIPSKK